MHNYSLSRMDKEHTGISDNETLADNTDNSYTWVETRYNLV